MKGVYVFLEMLQFFGIAAIFVVQVFTWAIVIDRLMKGKADRTDVLMLIPGFVFAGLIYVLVLQIPEAFKRKH